MCRVLQTYQATFRNSDPHVSIQTFTFARIMKTSHTKEQYFRLKVMSIHTGQQYPDPFDFNLLQKELFLTGFPAICRNCNYQDVGSNAKFDMNYFYLGNLFDKEYSNVEMILDEIPLSSFQIFSTAIGIFSVSFQIELLEK